MKNTNSTYPNEVIFVRQQNSFDLPKEETEYIVEKRNEKAVFFIHPFDVSCHLLG